MKKAIFITILLSIIVGCREQKALVASAENLDECPYSRFKFVGSTTVTSEKGFEVLDSLSIALEMEKNELLKTGKANNDLKIKVSNMLTETGTLSVPVSEEEATAYTRLSNAICTFRKDLYSENSIFKTPKQKEKAVDAYINLLTYVDDLKKKL